LFGIKISQMLSLLAIWHKMAIGTVIKKWWGKWLFGFFFWTLLGLSFASQFHISSAKAGLPITWKQAVSYALGDWYVFAVLSIPVIPLARRFRFEAGSRMGSLAAHAIGSAAFSLAYMVLRAWVGQWQSTASFGEAFMPLLVKTWHFNLLIYWVIVAVSQAFEYQRRYRERELRTSELEKRLAQAKLQALQMQLNPHFLFNTLHSISALMHKDVEVADRMVTRLGDLLRTALDSSDTQEVTLRQELKFLERYLEIEQIRFGDRLTVKREIPPDTLDAQVPNLILQPLVENAIRHGMGAHRTGDRLTLEVSDNGAGLGSGEPVTEGVGLSNTRARLHELYGEAHQFELRRGSEGGLLAQVTIPLRLEDTQHENSNLDCG
jgi:two-component system, LytTR family, sensor kinase